MREPAAISESLTLEYLQSNEFRSQTTAADWRPDCVFEATHLDRNRRLAYRQRSRGLRKTAVGRDSVKYLELVEIGHS